MKKEWEPEKWVRCRVFEDSDVYQRACACIKLHLLHRGHGTLFTFKALFSNATSPTGDSKCLTLLFDPHKLVLVGTRLDQWFAMPLSLPFLLLHVFLVAPILTCMKGDLFSLCDCMNLSLTPDCSYLRSLCMLTLGHIANPQ